MADIVAPTLAGPCLDESLGAVRIEDDEAIGVRADGDEVREEPVEIPRRRRTEALLRALLTPYDKSAALHVLRGASASSSCSCSRRSAA